MTHIYLASLTDNLRTYHRNTPPISGASDHASRNVARKMVALLIVNLLLPVILGDGFHMRQVAPGAATVETAIYRR